MDDVHLNTLLNDTEFDRQMCALFGDEWRWEMSFIEQRGHAKVWNFSRLYGMPAGRLKEVLMEQK
jgi:hypothetical protein